MQEVIVDCATGASTVQPLSADGAQQVAAQQSTAQSEEQARSVLLAFRQQQSAALAGVSALLHGPQGPADAAALAPLVHKLCADPALPLSAPEMAALARFVLRCLLP